MFLIVFAERITKERRIPSEKNWVINPIKPKVTNEAHPGIAICVNCLIPIIANITTADKKDKMMESKVIRTATNSL